MRGTKGVWIRNYCAIWASCDCIFMCCALFAAPIVIPKLICYLSMMSCCFILVWVIRVASCKAQTGFIWMFCIGSVLECMQSLKSFCWNCIWITCWNIGSSILEKQIWCSALIEVLNKVMVKNLKCCIVVNRAVLENWVVLLNVYRTREKFAYVDFCVWVGLF